MKVLTAAEMREVDLLTTERYGVPSLTLMENAGRSVALFIEQRYPNLARRRIVVLCGKGNNGGDGFVVARHLAEMGAKPCVFLFALPQDLRGDAAVNCQRWQDDAGQLHVVIHSSEWQQSRPAIISADILVDALLGTGVRGRIEGLLEEVIEGLNHANRAPGSTVASVDIPSGLDADTGEVGSVAIVADYTVTFTAPKMGLLVGAADRHVGRILVRDIGSPPQLIDEVGKSNVHWTEPGDLSQFAIPRRPTGHKGDYGHALVVAGSVGKSGAAVLASWAALRVGAGLVTVATPEPVLATVAAHTPEIMTEALPATATGSISLRSLADGRFESILKGKRALAIGPGLTTHHETAQLVRTIVGNRSLVPIILDADGLNAFAGEGRELRGQKNTIVLTPHPGEMARLLGCSTSDVQARRFEVAHKAAVDWNCYVILKGHQTAVAAPEGRIWVNPTGNPGMGTAGTGDVLTGMLAGLTAQYGADSWAAVLRFAVYLHGLAGDLAAAKVGEAPLMATDLIRFLPRAYKHFYAECGRG
jgi:hydroxyethylthiazole kinase-like uncharacterized protein yjeF